ncbi:MAG TPA: isoprenylcysteine carboxylmethyltransferase family protein [Geothrix sp.]|nr:isoprenylcysteine carboxylmethyltransferase family protein [Geothrix sp.]
MDQPRKSPQPPLLFFACLLAGWGMGHLHPLELPLPVPLRFSLAALFLLLAGLLGLWGLATFKRHHTTHRPNGVASALLTTGPFRLSRNPLYLGLACLLAAFGFGMDSAWLLGLTLLLVLLLDRLVIAREEVRLRAQFGETYLAYTRRVRRWF